MVVLLYLWFGTAQRVQLGLYALAYLEWETGKIPPSSKDRATGIDRIRTECRPRRLDACLSEGAGQPV